MKLNAEAQRKVEENLGLINKVINDKVHGPYHMGIYSREDLFQIGCIGLCKAAGDGQRRQLFDLCLQTDLESDM